MTPVQVYNQLVPLVEAGDDKAISAFITKHITEFPEEVQEHILFAAFENAVALEDRTLATIDAIQDEVLEDMRVLNRVEEELSNHERIDELKQTLSVQEEGEQKDN